MFRLIGLNSDFYYGYQCGDGDYFGDGEGDGTGCIFQDKWHYRIFTDWLSGESESLIKEYKCW